MRRTVAEITKPDYIVQDVNGLIVRIHCKVCGATICQLERGNLIRLGNYAELKMKFADGSKHVTNVCTGCVNAVAMSGPLMLACHDADIIDLMRELPGMESQLVREKPKCVAIDTRRRGII